MGKVFRVIVFLLSSFIYHAIGSMFFPVDEVTNTLLAPDWYVFVILGLGAATTFGLNFLIKKRSKSDVLGARNHIAEENLPTLYGDAIDLIFKYDQASASLLQRYLKISFSNAESILKCFESAKIVSEFSGTYPRIILASDPAFAKRMLNRWLVENGSLSKGSTENLGDNDSVKPNFSKIDFMAGHDFEYWCADLLRKNEFKNVEVTKGSGDQGVDVLAEKGGIKYAIQCKCYSSDLGNTPIQEVEAGRIFYGCHVGVVMTNRYFTKGAKELAEKTNTLLWDRDFLFSLSKNVALGKE